MDSKLLGSILLIVGTSIGAGMLALPIVSAQLGFMGSLMLLVACWMVMTLSAFILLEANLWLPHNSNIISMAKATIGPVGQLLAYYVLILRAVVIFFVTCFPLHIYSYLSGFLLFFLQWFLAPLFILASILLITSIVV